MLIVEYDKIPNCGICGKPMKEWTAMADKHYHVHCFVDMSVEKLSELLTLELNEILIEVGYENTKDYRRKRD